MKIPTRSLRNFNHEELKGNTMNKFKTTLVIAAIIATALPVMAQRKRISPHETISATIDGNKVTIVYGRPYSKNPNTGEIRKIWGGLVPYGKVWRTGADEKTLLKRNNRSCWAGRMFRLAPTRYSPCPQPTAPRS